MCVVHTGAFPDKPDLRPLLVRDPQPFAGLSPDTCDRLLAAAARHGLLSAVAGRLPPDDAGLGERWRHLERGARLRDARLREVLEEVLRVLAAAGVTPIALKGPVLADRLYPDPGLRPSTDLDLLVPEAALDRAVAALAGVGFGRSAPLVDAYQRRHHHHLHLPRQPGPDVELHFRPHSACGARLPAAAFIARALPYRTARGTPVQILSPEDELVALAIHATGHLLERGAWLLDLLLFVERYPLLDWATIAKRSVEFRCRRSVAYALDEVRRLGGSVPSPAGLRLGTRRSAVAAALGRWALAGKGRLGTGLRMAFELVLWDRSWCTPAYVMREGGWFLRRRAHLVARWLTGRVPRRAPPGPRSTRGGTKSKA